MLGQISRSSRQNLQGETWMCRSGWSFTILVVLSDWQCKARAALHSGQAAQLAGCCCWLCAVANLRDLPAAEKIPETVGSLMIIGGSERFDQREYWKRL